jgi:tetratricopeptide (TPR) repeat protein
MNESRQQRSRLPALVQFFDWWYEREEREQKRRALVDRLLAGDASPADVERHLVTLDHLSDAGADEERIEAKARAAAAMQQAGRAADSSKYLDEVNALKPGGVMQWLTLHRELWAETSRWPDPIAQVEKMIACWELQRAGQLEEFSARLLKVGLSLQGKGLHAALADLLLSSAQGLEDPRAKFHFLLQAAGSQEMSGDWRAALGSLATARGLAVGAKDRGLEGAALNNIGGIYRACGDYGRALECFEQSLAICREVGDRVVEGATLSNIGGIHLARGDYGRALDCLERSLATHRGIGHRVGEGVALNNISQVYHARGDYGRALKHLDLSLRIRREIGDRAGEGATLNNIGMVYDARKDHERALEYWQESLAICREIGDRAGEATVLSNIGSVYFARRDFARAAEYLGQSLATTREIGDRADLCRGLFNLGRIQAAGRDARSATSSWLAAFRIASGIGLSEALHSLEDLAKELGHPEGLAFWESLLEKGEAKESDVLAAAPHPLPLSQRERGEPGPHPNPLPEGEGTQEPSP